MALIAPPDQERLRAEFAKMTRRVRLVFFTQALDCSTCVQTRQILDELTPLSDRIWVDEINFVFKPDKAKQYGIDRAPAIAVTYEEGGETNGRSADVGAPWGDAAVVIKDARIRFVGAPAGYEFTSLVLAILLAGGRESQLSSESRARLAQVDQPITMQVFTTPTCSQCPRAVTLAHEMAFASPHITAYAVEATEFPDLAGRYHVSGVPKTVVNDQVEILGALPESAYIEQALAI
jgi:glutaredoxin-like protein